MEFYLTTTLTLFVPLFLLGALLVVLGVRRSSFSPTAILWGLLFFGSSTPLAPDLLVYFDFWTLCKSSVQREQPLDVDEVVALSFSPNGYLMIEGLQTVYYPLPNESLADERPGYAALSLYAQEDSAVPPQCLEFSARQRFIESSDRTLPRGVNGLPGCIGYVHQLDRPDAVVVENVLGQARTRITHSEYRYRAITAADGEQSFDLVRQFVMDMEDSTFIFSWVGFGTNEARCPSQPSFNVADLLS